MNLAGMLTMAFCWLFATGFSAFLIVKTLRKPENTDTEQ